jgi:RNA processing factor Prp31
VKTKIKKVKPRKMDAYDHYNLFTQKLSNMGIEALIWDRAKKIKSKMKTCHFWDLPQPVIIEFIKILDELDDYRNEFAKRVK